MEDNTIFPGDPDPEADYFCQMPLYSGGKQVVLKLDEDRASVVASYMASCGWALRNQDPGHIARFAGKGIRDVHGRLWPFETRMNTIARLSETEPDFPELYDPNR